MNLYRYELEVDRSLLIFEFISQGPKGKITKQVQYKETNIKNYYNLGFGDKNSQTNDIDDSVITNNGDGKKILATVASTVIAFTNQYPDAWIYAKGNSRARNRLYRIGISNNLEELLKDFEVYGLCREEWLAFNKGMECDAFLIRRKKF